MFLFLRVEIFHQSTSQNVKWDPLRHARSMMSQASYESDDDPLLLVPSDRPLKRRRIESSPDEEIVESSDAEEREEIAATSPSYWRRLDVKHAQSLRQSGVEDVVMNVRGALNGVAPPVLTIESSFRM